MQFDKTIRLRFSHCRKQPLRMLMTTALAARRLGVSHERLLDWVARKLLPIAGEDEEGRVLLREPVVMERGEALARTSFLQNR